VTRKNGVLSGRNGPARPSAAGRSRPSQSLPALAGPTRPLRGRPAVWSDCSSPARPGQTLIVFGRVLIVRARSINRAKNTAFFSQRNSTRSCPCFSPRVAGRARGAPPSPRGTRGYHLTAAAARRLRRLAPPRCAATPSWPAPHRIGTRPPGPVPDVSLSLARASTSRWSSPAWARARRARAVRVMTWCRRKLRETMPYSAELGGHRTVSRRSSRGLRLLSAVIMRKAGRRD
jgi:hypothetical protein